VRSGVFEDLADGFVEQRKAGTASVAQHAGEIILWADRAVEWVFGVSKVE
jgi:hypothetical protein